MQGLMPMKTFPLWPGAFMLTATLVAASLAMAQSPSPREALEALYHSTNGDDWHRNDGWLDEEVHWCDWHGVRCQYRSSIDDDIIWSLELPNNNLTGELPGSLLFEHVFWHLDLSNNDIGGQLERIPASPGEIDLSNNRLSGNLPTEKSQQAGRTGDVFFGPPSFNWHLNLAGNDFEGDVPSTWTRVNWMDLSDNRLEGMPTSLLEGERHPAYLNLAGNRFSGPLPASITETRLLPRNGGTRWGGGLNLCWNDFEIDDPDIAEWVALRHVGGPDYERCLVRERVALDANISGSWYDPTRDGEGIVVHQLDEGSALLYWFGFDDAGRQMWLFEVGRTGQSEMVWPALQRTQGDFSAGLGGHHAHPMRDRGQFRIDRTGDDILQVERVYVHDFPEACILPYPPPLGCFGFSLTDRLDYEPLIRLAGTTCDNQSSHQQYSGAWYNPEANGEGFIVEVLPDHNGVVYWFTYTPDGSGEQAWMMGDGHFEGQTLIIDNLLQPVGTRFGPDFDTGEIDFAHWGRLEIEFDDDLNGHIWFDSVDEDYGSGNSPIERLARPMLAECD
jgi:hypothetical protein